MTKPRKSKISDYFQRTKPVEAKENEEEKKEENQNQSTSTAAGTVNVQNLKCPKRKVLPDDDDDGTDGKKKRAIRKRGANVGKGQMVLDAGQKNIGNITCEQCEMVYCVDDEEDLRTHEEFHKKSQLQFEIPSHHAMQLLAFANRDMNEVLKVFYCGAFAEEPFKKLMNKHIEKINTLLGYSVPVDELWTENKRIFLILKVVENRMTIGGLLIVEKIQKAWTNETRREISQGEDINDWIVGVDRLWVDPFIRRKSVALTLLDAATTQDRGMEFRPRRLRMAMSDPTDDGVKVAKKFIETRYTPEHQFDGEILVY